MKLSVIIPVYNEASTIKSLIDKVLQVPVEKEIIVVDDYSTDGTKSILQKIKNPIIKVFYHRINQGKGAAIRTGIKEVQTELVLIQDADLEYDPEEYPKLMDPILRGLADVVYGSRFAGSSKRVLPFWHSMGNKILTVFSNMFTNLDLTDMETCYKVFRSDIIKNIHLESNRFGFEPEITVKIARLNFRIYEIPISYHGRWYGQGKKIGWKDGITALYSIVKYRFSSQITKSPIGYQAMSKLQATKNYNAWLFGKIENSIGNRVLEIGSGVGNISKLLVGRDRVLLSDINDEYLEFVKNDCPEREELAIRKYDLNSLPVPQLQEENLDTVVCMRVLEHIKDDTSALQDIYSILSDKGKLLLVVPALKSLYGYLDQSLQHYRRYEKESLCDRLNQIGFHIDRVEYFNCLGVVGWYLNSKILRRKSFPIVQFKMFDFMIPLLKYERLFQLKKGLSLIIVASKNDGKK